MKKGKLIVSICAFALAAVFVVLSFIDSIAIIGKYRAKGSDEFDKEAIEDTAEYYDIDEKDLEKVMKDVKDAAKMHLIFSASGDLEVQASIDEKKLTKAMKEYAELIDEDIDEDELEEFVKEEKERIEEANDEYDSAEWELDDGKLILKFSEGDEEYECDYEIGFSTLEFEVDEDDLNTVLPGGMASIETTYQKEGVDLFFCPSMILREVALCLIILGVLLLIIKGKKPYVPSIATVEVTSATHTIPPVFSESYGTSVGGAIEKKEPEYSGYVSPAPAYEAAPTAPAVKYCENCGGILADDNKFCEVCGTPVAGAVEQSVPEYSGYVSPAPAAPAVKYCENCGNVLTEGFKFCQECGTPTASAPTEELKFEEAGDARLKSTFREVEPSYDSTPPVTVSAPETSGSTSAPSSDMSFSQAGDL